MAQICGSVLLTIHMIYMWIYTRYFPRMNLWVHQVGVSYSTRRLQYLHTIFLFTLGGSFQCILCCSFGYYSFILVHLWVVSYLEQLPSKGERQDTHFSITKYLLTTLVSNHHWPVWCLYWRGHNPTWLVPKRGEFRAATSIVLSVLCGWCLHPLQLHFLEDAGNDLAWGGGECPHILGKGQMIRLA